MVFSRQSSQNFYFCRGTALTTSSILKLDQTFIHCLGSTFPLCRYSENVNQSSFEAIRFGLEQRGEISLMYKKMFVIPFSCYLCNM